MAKLSGVNKAIAAIDAKIADVKAQRDQEIEGLVNAKHILVGVTSVRSALRKRKPAALPAPNVAAAGQ